MVQRAIKIIKRSIKTFVLFYFVSFYLKAAFLVPAPALPATLPSPLLPSAEFISPPVEHPGTNPRMGHEVYMLNNGWWVYGSCGFASPRCGDRVCVFGWGKAGARLGQL